MVSVLVRARAKVNAPVDNAQAAASIWRLAWPARVTVIRPVLVGPPAATLPAVALRHRVREPAQRRPIGDAILISHNPLGAGT